MQARKGFDAHPLIMEALLTVIIVIKRPLVWTRTRMPISTKEISCGETETGVSTSTWGRNNVKQSYGREDLAWVCIEKDKSNFI